MNSSALVIIQTAATEMGINAPSPNASQPPYGVFIYVNNTDELYNKALKNGARALMPPRHPTDRRSSTRRVYSS